MNRVLNGIGAIINKLVLLKGIFRYLGGNRYRIIYYHLISDTVPDYYFKDKGISFNQFKSQIEHFKKYYKFISLSEAIRKYEHGESLKGYMSITTDDGFIENYTLICPFLEKNKIPATLFLIERCIDNKHLMWRNKLAYIQNTLGLQRTNELLVEFTIKENLPAPLNREDVMAYTKRVLPMNSKDELSNKFWEFCKMEPIEHFMQRVQPYMTTEQIHELVTRGFELGAHGVTHPYCKKLNREELEHEVIGSIDKLNEKFNNKITAFSYPFGSRAEESLEHELIKKHSKKVKALIGIKHKHNNNSTPYTWERDLQEAKPGMAAFRFYILPFLRRIGIM